MKLKDCVWLGLFFRRRLMSAAVVIAGLLACPKPVGGAPFTVGDLLVTSQPGNLLYEYTRGGALVQTITVPSPPNATRSYQVGGVLVDSNGYVDVAQFAAASPVYISAYQASTQTWRHFSAAPANGISNILDLDLARFQTNIYVSVIDSYQLDAANNYAVTKLPQSTEPSPNVGNSAVSVGLDGLLYIANAGSPKRNISVVNPSTFAVIRTLALSDSSGLPINAEGIATTTDGSIYVADQDGVIYKYRSTGTLLSSFNTNLNNPDTLALYPDGTLALGAREGDVYLTNTSFSTHSQFTLPDMNIDYVGFVTAVPEPSTEFLFAIGGVALISSIRRRSRFRYCGPAVSKIARPD